MGTVTKTGLDASSTASKKVVHETAEATGELIRNKINEKIVKTESVSDDKSEMLKKCLFHQRKKGNIKQIKASITKQNKI